MTLRVTTDDGLATVALDRPEVRNAIDLQLMTALRDALGALKPEHPKALVLTGTGTAFCAGADLALVRNVVDEDDFGILAELVDLVADVVLALRSFPCPTVTAVEGPAVGAGMGLALATDLRVLGRSATFIPGYFSIAATPDGGGSYFLARTIGSARTIAALLRNEPIDALTLAAWGLADEVVNDGGVLDAARALAWRVSVAPPLALVGMRKLVDAATTQSLEDQLAAERVSIASLWPTQDYGEGVRAFLERRPPRFEGR